MIIIVLLICVFIWKIIDDKSFKTDPKNVGNAEIQLAVGGRMDIEQ